MFYIYSVTILSFQKHQLLKKQTTFGTLLWTQLVFSSEHSQINCLKFPV